MYLSIYLQNTLLANVNEIDLFVAINILILGIFLFIESSFISLFFDLASSIKVNPIPTPILVNSATNSWLTTSILGINLTLSF